MNNLTERQEQIKLHKWCKLKNLVSFAVPNGGSRHKLEAINLKREGVTAGVADYIVMLQDVILFIELKSAPRKLKSGKYSISHTKVSDEQKSFLSEVDKFRYADSRVCYGFDESVEFIESWF